MLQQEGVCPPGLLDPMSQRNNPEYYPYNALGAFSTRNNPYALDATNQYWDSQSSTIDNFASYSQPFYPNPSYSYSPEYPSEYSSHSLKEVSYPSLLNSDTVCMIPSMQDNNEKPSFALKENAANDPSYSFIRSQPLSDQMVSSIPGVFPLPQKGPLFSSSTHVPADIADSAPHSLSTMRNYTTVREFIPSKSSSSTTSSMELAQEPAAESCPNHDSSVSMRKMHKSIEHQSGVSRMGSRKGKKHNGRVSKEDDVDA